MNDKSDIAQAIDIMDKLNHYNITPVDQIQVAIARALISINERLYEISNRMANNEH